MDPQLKALHEKDTIAFHRAGLYAAMFFISAPIAVIAWENGYWPVTVFLWLVMAHLGHINLFVLHEASHYLLHPKRLLNEAQGILVGTFSLVPLSSYRYVHGCHHVYLAQPGDIELWPYTDPKTSRGFRIFAATMEFIFGYIWTPLVFLRGCIIGKKMSKNQRLRIIAEYSLCVLLWTTILGVTAYFNVWGWLLVGYIVPSLMTGSMQTARRFIEHMGLYGNTPDTATRTIDDRSLLGRFLSFTMLHGDIHGPHHVHAKIPQSHLPEALELLKDQGILTQESLFPNYWSATKVMLRELGNPRIGSQWIAKGDTTSTNERTSALAG